MISENENEEEYQPEDMIIQSLFQLDPSEKLATGTYICIFSVLYVTFIFSDYISLLTQ